MTAPAELVLDIPKEWWRTWQPIPHPLAHELDLFERAVALKESNRG